MGERPELLRTCDVCGCKGNGTCGRLIDPKDQSIYPDRDTGFRMKKVAHGKQTR